MDLQWFESELVASQMHMSFLQDSYAITKWDFFPLGVCEWFVQKWTSVNVKGKTMLSLLDRLDESIGQRIVLSLLDRLDISSFSDWHGGQRWKMTM